MSSRRSSYAWLAIGLFLAFVAVVVGLRWYSIYKRAQMVETRVELHTLKEACLDYKSRTGHFPRQECWSRELVLYMMGDDDFVEHDSVGWGLRDVADCFYDAWGRPYRYRFPGSRDRGTFEVYSVGPNGCDEQGEGDDVWDGEDEERRTGDTGGGN